MKTRRQFIKFTIEFLSAVGVFFNGIGPWLKRAYARTKRTIVPKGTDLSSLRNEDPATLDTRDLEILPLKDFKTMGLTDHQVDLKSWRLIMTGNLAAPRNLSYSQILELPSMERNVLLICPGVFTNHGKWKGISLMTVLNLAGMETDTTHIRVFGPQGDYEKEQLFPIADVRSDKVFLAYAVNGEKLPQKHGFPLRIVAEDYYGSDWIKYVYKIEALKVES